MTRKVLHLASATLLFSRNEFASDLEIQLDLLPTHFSLQAHFHGLAVNTSARTYEMIQQSEQKREESQTYGFFTLFERLR